MLPQTPPTISPDGWPPLPEAWYILLTQWAQVGPPSGERAWVERLEALLAAPAARGWIRTAEQGAAGVRTELFQGAQGVRLVGRRWAGGEHTPVHDHGGAAGAEVVVKGALQMRTYRWADDRLQEADATLAMTHTIVSLAPNLIHEAANLLVNQVSVSLHLYGPAVRPPRVYLVGANEGGTGC
jgi:hypothetical protein